MTDGDEVQQSIGGVESVDLSDIGKACFQAIIGRYGVAGQPSAVKDRQQIVRAQGAVRSPHNNIVDVDKAEQFRLNAGFFADFAQCSIARGFAGFDMAARQAPDEASWVLAAQSDQELAIVAENRGACCSLRPMADGRRFLRVGLGQVFAFPAGDVGLAWLKMALKDTMIEGSEREILKAAMSLDQCVHVTA